MTSVAFARLPTQAQLNNLCVPVILKIDNQIHWFYWKHITEFNEQGLRVKFGKNLSQEAFYPETEIINLQSAIKRYKEIKGSQ